MIKFIGRFLQRQREKRICAAAKWNKHQQWLLFMRRNGVIMPQPRPDDRSALQIHNRILARQ